MVYHLLEKRERRVEIYFALYREEVFVVLFSLNKEIFTKLE
jgi:hypothetical protein